MCTQTYRQLPKTEKTLVKTNTFKPDIIW